MTQNLSLDPKPLIDYNNGNGIYHFIILNKSKGVLSKCMKNHKNIG